MSDQFNNQIVTGDGEPTDITINPGEINALGFVNPSEMPDLDAAPVGVSIVPKYFEFKHEGERLRCIYVGQMTMTTNTGSVPAVAFQNKDGFWINGGVAMVNAVSKLAIGTPIEIEYLGKETTTNGHKVMKYDVRLLNVAVNVQRQPSSAATQTQSRTVPARQAQETKHDIRDAILKAKALRLQLESPNFKPTPNEFWPMAQAAGFDTTFSQNIIHATKSDGRYDFRAALTALLDEFDKFCQREGIDK